ncbi:MAG: flagellar biosynthesis protein FlhA [Firmicutes bacterium]|jgi:flagellar biosynthesis protein FlhA|nr:flagellar biosynthesis protein FlhA [Bacillota bacterium]
MAGQSWLQRGLEHADLLTVFAVVLILVMFVFPLPPALLDVVLALNITASFLVLLLTMNLRHPLELSAFPSLLLLLTLFRLGLNVSSTRLLLLRGYAGQLIQAFGQFVIGGNYVVGFVVFLILVVIQFIVITKGAERVAEVAARFTLDAMPGKQMSVDADLNSGVISQEEARRRRQEIQQEANFYGAMDGASKFVKGDAIAGLVITAINILGGLAVGVGQQGLAFGEALQKYALLTVGDGLVSQIPALLVSTATGIIITRAAAENNLGEDLASQMLFQPRILQVAGAVMALVGIVPGLPAIPFFIIGGLCWSLGLVLGRAAQSREMQEAEEDAARRLEESKKPEAVLSLLQHDRMELEIGYGLIGMVDAEQGGDVLERITLLRRQIALDLGFVVPAIRIRDNMQLPPQGYAIRVLGVEVGRGELMPDRLLAMGPGVEGSELEGIMVQDPAFGLPAIWIPRQRRLEAEEAGLTVVEPGAVLATHLTEIIRRHAAELLGRSETKMLLDSLRPDNSALIDELIPDVVSLGDVQKVLQNLLREGVAIRNLLVILETLADHGRRVKEPEMLTELVRESLARQLSQQYANEEGHLLALALDPQVEQELTELLNEAGQGGILPWDRVRVQAFMESLSTQVRPALARGEQPVLLTPPGLRLPLWRLLQRSLPQLPVLSYNEVVSDMSVQILGLVGVEHAS